VLDVVVRRAIEDRHLVRRHAVDRADLVILELAKLDELQVRMVDRRERWISMPYSVIIGLKRFRPPNFFLKTVSQVSLRTFSSLKCEGCSSQMLGRASFSKKLEA
jgi:hypothetical protein